MNCICSATEHILIIILLNHSYDDKFLLVFHWIRTICTFRSMSHCEDHTLWRICFAPNSPLFCIVISFSSYFLRFVRCWVFEPVQRKFIYSLDYNPNFLSSIYYNFFFSSFHYEACGQRKLSCCYYVVVYIFRYGSVVAGCDPVRLDLHYRSGIMRLGLFTCLRFYQVNYEYVSSPFLPFIELKNFHFCCRRRKIMHNLQHSTSSF